MLLQETKSTKTTSIEKLLFSFGVLTAVRFYVVDLKLCVLVSAGTSRGFKDTLDWSVVQPFRLFMECQIMKNIKRSKMSFSEGGQHSSIKKLLVSVHPLQKSYFTLHIFSDHPKSVGETPS